MCTRQRQRLVSESVFRCWCCYCHHTLSVHTVYVYLFRFYIYFYFCCCCCCRPSLGLTLNEWKIKEYTNVYAARLILTRE